MTDPLEEPRPAFDLAGARSLASQLYGLEGELDPLHGERDLNFRIDTAGGLRYLLKIHNPADGAGTVAMRNGALSHLRGVDPDLPVPEVLPSLAGEQVAVVTGPDGRQSQVQLFSFLDGRHASREEPDERALYDWGRMTARLGRALRGYFHPAAGYPIQWDLRHTGALRDRLELLEDRHRALATEVVDRFEAGVAPVLPSLRAQVVHNDLSRENVLVDDACEIVGVTDFGDMTHTALVCDLAVALADVLDGRKSSLELAEPMIAGYCSVTPLEHEEQAVLGDLVAARAATAVVVSTWRRGRHPDAPGFPEGAVELLLQFEAAGFSAAAARLGRAAGGGTGGGTGGSPAPTRRGPELLAARRRVLGPLGLSYDEPLHLVRGKGVHVYDADGRRYLDAYNNVPVVGHCHPAVAAAIAAQSRLLVTNTRYVNDAGVELAERLLATAPGRLDRVLFLNSGSEANDVAWRIARHATGRGGAVVTGFAYHGVTEATTDFSPEEWPPGFAPGRVALTAPPAGAMGLRGARELPDVAAAAGLLADSGRGLAALLVDSAFTSDGILGPANDWLRRAAAVVAAEGGCFVADEVQAGYGRTGDGLWSVTSSGVEPDFMTLGKPMGNGFPVAAVLGRSDLVDPFIEETGYFSTFGGNTLACAAALAVLDVVESEGLVAHAGEVGRYLGSLLVEVAGRHEAVGELRCWGLLCGLEIVAPGGDGELRPDAGRARGVVNRLRHLGVLVGTTGPAENVVKIRPPLVFDRHDADELVGRLDEALDGT